MKQWYIRCFCIYTIHIQRAMMMIMMHLTAVAAATAAALYLPHKIMQTTTIIAREPEEESIICVQNGEVICIYTQSTMILYTREMRMSLSSSRISFSSTHANDVCVRRIITFCLSFRIFMCFVYNIQPRWWWWWWLDVLYSRARKWAQGHCRTEVAVNLAYGSLRK